MDKLSKDEIREKIKEILVKDFDCAPDSISDESKLFEDLDLDSIDAVDLVVRLQSFVNRKVYPDEFKSIRTLGDLVEVINKIVNE